MKNLSITFWSSFEQRRNMHLLKFAYDLSFDRSLLQPLNGGLHSRQVRTRSHDIKRRQFKVFTNAQIEKSVSFQIRMHWNSQSPVIHEFQERRELTVILTNSNNRALLNLWSAISWNLICNLCPTMVTMTMLNSIKKRYQNCIMNYKMGKY